MIAESGLSWSDRWEKEGEAEALKRARGVLLRDLERRFGPLPEEVCKRVEAIPSIEELIERALRAGAASSLADLTAS